MTEYCAHVEVELAPGTEFDTDLASANEMFMELLGPLREALDEAGIDCANLGTDGKTVDLFWYRDNALAAQAVMVDALKIAQANGWTPIRAGTGESRQDMAEA